MADPVKWSAELVHCNGQSIVGKTRFQKIAFLLEELDLGVGIEFDYHNFGPFSAELAFGIDDAIALGYLKEEKKSGFHSMPYSVFKNSKDVELEMTVQNQQDIAKALNVFESYSAVVLELAATAVYLSRNGYSENCWGEVISRKSSKATDKNISKAKELLEAVSLRV